MRIHPLAFVPFLGLASCVIVVEGGNGGSGGGGGGATSATASSSSTSASSSIAASSSSSTGGGGGPMVSSCGDTSGLQAGAAWPMVGGCPARRALSPHVGSQTGNVKWSIPMSTTAIWVVHLTIDAAGTVYVPTGSALHAVQPDGTTKWTASFSAFHPPVIGADGTLHATSYGDYLLHALSPADGSVLWSTAQMGGQYTEPAARADGAILGVFGLQLGAVAAGGQLLWSSSLLTNVGIDGSPTLAPDGTAHLAFWGQSGATVATFDTAGQLAWQRALGLGGATRNVVLGPDGTIYVGEGKRLHALTAAGDELWSIDLGANPAIFEWMAFGPEGTLYVVDSYDTPGIHALQVSPAGATLKWSLSVGGNYASAPVVGADGTIYVALEDVFYALRPDGTQLWTYSQGYCGTPAIAADGTTYAVCDHQLVAFAP